MPAQVLPFYVECFINIFDLKHFKLSWFYNVLRYTGIKHRTVNSFTVPYCILQMERSHSRSNHIVVLFRKHHNLYLLDQGHFTTKVNVPDLNWILQEDKLGRCFGVWFFFFFSIKPNMTCKWLFGFFFFLESRFIWRIIYLYVWVNFSVRWFLL